MVIYPGPRGIIGASRSKIVLYYGKTVAPNALLPRASLRLSLALAVVVVSHLIPIQSYLSCTMHIHMPSVSKLINH